VSLAAPRALTSLAIWAVLTVVVVGAIAAGSRWAARSTPKAVAV
jgi:hypothetical protein